MTSEHGIRKGSSGINDPSLIMHEFVWAWPGEPRAIVGVWLKQPRVKHSSYILDPMEELDSTPPISPPLSPPLSPSKTAGVSGHTPFLIGVAGGTASGKTSVCLKIMEMLGQKELDCKQQQVVMVSQDSFYKNLSQSEIAQANKGEYNFDHPGITAWYSRW